MHLFSQNSYLNSISLIFDELITVYCNLIGSQSIPYDQNIPQSSYPSKDEVLQIELTTFRVFETETILPIRFTDSITIA